MVGKKRQFKPNNSLYHRSVKPNIKQLGIINTAFGRTCTTRQVIPDRSTDREDVPRHAMMAIYSDATNLVTPGPKTVGGLHLSYVTMRPGIEAPHTLFASLME